MNCEGEHDIMWMNFNQDGTSLSAGAKAGFYLYGLNNATEKLDVRRILLYLNQISLIKNKKRKIQDHFDESAQDIILVERLFNSSLVVTVSRENARKIRVYHFRKVYLFIRVGKSGQISDYYIFVLKKKHNFSKICPQKETCKSS